MSILDERTRIPLGWAITIFTSLAGVVSTAAISHYRLGQLEEGWAQFQKESREYSDRSQAQILRIQRVEDKLDSIGSSLERIDARLERMEANDVKK